MLKGVIAVDKVCGEKREIAAPMTGEVYPLCDVPDAVFSEGTMGDGVAILPKDGKIYSPVDGVLDSIAETKHVFGFHADAGYDVLVHVGLDTAKLKGEDFTLYAAQGDSVKVGDLVAEMDLELLKEKRFHPITPVVLCGGEEEIAVKMSCGGVVAGKDTVILLADSEQKAMRISLEERKEGREKTKRRKKRKRNR